MMIVDSGLLFWGPPCIYLQATAAGLKTTSGWPNPESAVPPPLIFHFDHHV